MLVYPVELKDDDGTVLVEFPDVLEAITYGDDRDEALIHAVDALETMLMSLISGMGSRPR
jgi:antitoxin HicB